jgi:hypothetical protein
MAHTVGDRLVRRAGVRSWGVVAFVWHSRNKTEGLYSGLT